MNTHLFSFLVVSLPGRLGVITITPAILLITLILISTIIAFLSKPLRRLFWEGAFGMSILLQNTKHHIVPLGLFALGLALIPVANGTPFEGLAYKIRDYIVLIIGIVALWKGTMGKGGIFSAVDAGNPGSGAWNILFLILGAALVIGASGDLLSGGELVPRVFGMFLSELPKNP